MKPTTKYLTEPADKRPTTTPHGTFKYSSLTTVMKEHGWQKQLADFTIPREVALDKQRVEWWNRGVDVVLVSVLPEVDQCNIWIPGTQKRVISALLPKKAVKP